MGRGDKRTRKGKIYKGSYGKRRPHGTTKKKKKSGPRR
jgi:ribosomal small subunit protein bTHX